MIKILPQIILGLWGIMPGNYSGISHVKDNIYAIVDDKDPVDGFKYLTLDIDSVTGKVHNAMLTEPPMMAERRSRNIKTKRDCEGVAYFKSQNTIFVSGEEEQRILEYTVDGEPTGRELAIPECMSRQKIAGNLGFEALTYNDVQKRFWTTTESTLIDDGEQASARNRNVYNMLRLLSFGTDLQPAESFIYQMDLPKGKSSTATSIHGVPSLSAMDDGRLLVMEREGFFPKHQYGSWVRIKIYVVDPGQTSPTDLSTPISAIKPQQILPKTLLCSFVTRLRIGKMNLSNYEGMCLGPKLTDGRQTLILIADSQNGMGNWMYHIKDHLRIIIF